MKLLSATPIKTWVFWSITVLSVFLCVTWKQFVSGLTVNANGISFLIIGFFLYGFLASFKVAIHLQKEWNALIHMSTEKKVISIKPSAVGKLFESAIQHMKNGGKINARNLISSYSLKNRAQVDNVNVVSGMLVTIGLLGTVSGLIISVSGLEKVLATTGADPIAMRAGLNETFSGMGAAFYTTFFGALLGGIVLKVLAIEMRKSSTLLTAEIIRFSELYISPLPNQDPMEVIEDFKSKLNEVTEMFNNFGSGFSKVMTTLKDKEKALSSGLGELIKSVDKSIQYVNETTDARLSSIVETSVNTNKQADERLQAIISNTEKVNQLADERLETLAETINQNMDNVYNLADKKVEALIEAADKSLEEIRKRNEKQLDEKSASLAQRLSEAANLLSLMVKTSQQNEPMPNN